MSSMNTCVTHNSSIFTFLSDFSDPSLVQIALESLSLSLIFVCAMIGNVLMLVAILKSGKVLSTTHILLTNLVSSGLCFSVLIPAIIIIRITTEWRMGYRFCKVFNYNEFVSGMCSILTMTSISYDRYMNIKNGGKHRLTKRALIIIVIIIWGISAAFSVPITIYQGMLEHHKKEQICETSPADNSSSTHESDNKECRLVCKSFLYCGVIWPKDFHIMSYILVICLFFYVMPLILFFVFYTKIFLIVRQSSRRVAHHICANATPRSSPDDTSDNSSSYLTCVRAASRHEVRLAKMSGVIIFTFVIMWMPFFILNFIGGMGVNIRSSYYIIAVIFAHLNVCVNPFVYGYFNPAFREQCRLFLLSLIRFTGAIKTSVLPQHNKTTSGTSAEGPPGRDGSREAKSERAPMELEVVGRTSEG